VNRFVVDASVVLVWCFPMSTADLADRVADMLRRGDSAIVPAFWPHEVLNALLVGEKRGRIAGDLLRNFISGLASLTHYSCAILDN
jgi:predicted nucleic acid-binding protein